MIMIIAKTPNKKARRPKGLKGTDLFLIANIFVGDDYVEENKSASTKK